jgi:hypothetical protein
MANRNSKSTPMRELPHGGFTGSFLVSVEAPSCLRDGCIQFRVFSGNKTTLHLGYSSSRVFVNQKPVGLRGLRLVTGSSLSSVAFRPAGIVGFHTVTESWFLPPGCRPRTSEVGTDLCGSPCLRGLCLRTFRVPLRWRFRRNRPTSEALG